MHEIFKNQPPHYFYDKSFDDYDDGLFLKVNDIHPLALKQDEDKFISDFPIDPRNRRLVKKHEIDTTIEPKSIILPQSGKSILSKREHATLLEFLKTKQEHKSVDHSSIAAVTGIKTNFNRERNKFQKMAKNYEENYKDDLFGCTSELMMIYRSWYEQESHNLLKDLNNTVYNTFSALPHIMSNSWDKEKTSEISNIEMLETKIQDESKKNLSIDFKNIRHLLSSYCLDFRERGFGNKEIDGIHQKKGVDFERPSCYLSLDSLLFLITSGTYLDLPTEMILKIEDMEQTSLKKISFEKPLPSGECGRNIYNSVLEQAGEVFKNKCTEYLPGISDKNRNLDICCKISNNQNKAYKLETFEDFLKKRKESRECDFSSDTTNSGLVKWTLRLSDPDSKGINIFTSIRMPGGLTESLEEDYFTCDYVKIEYKPQFGCEMLTQYELLKAWFHLKLLGEVSKVKYCTFTRVAASNFETQLEEKVVLSQIEYYLKQNYKIYMPHLLYKLEELLNMLMQMPNGDYLLRYCTKFSDKLILAQPTSNPSMNSIELHTLLQRGPTDLNFITYDPYLPIADHLCGIMHIKYTIAPCLFWPSISRDVKKLRTEVFNDRPKILKMLKDKKTKFEEETALRKRKFKKLKNKRQNKRSTEKRHLQNKDLKELQEEMEIEEKLFASTKP